ncbi:MAG: 16S rRNA (guanine(966)-N(2))-methyltransferase RsmD [Chromatiaceae bacterium]
MASGRLRIIGGRYRGRKLPVPDQPGLRPTGDRVRETLFNWLQPVIEGARCLDLYSGSGALAFEAASRGAAEVVMVEQAEPVARILEANIRLLGASELRVVRGDALDWLSVPGGAFDIVYLDPPFAAGLLAPSCELLERNRWLAPQALVYIEAPANEGLPRLPGSWRLVRDKQTGQVRYALAMRAA